MVVCLVTKRAAAVEIGAKAAEYAAVFRIVAVNDGIWSIKTIHTAIIHEDCAQPISLALECRLEVFVVILALHQRIVNLRAVDAQPVDVVHIDCG